MFEVSFFANKLKFLDKECKIRNKLLYKYVNCFKKIFLDGYAL